MAPNIKYIPPQMDPLASTSTQAALEDPFRLLGQDTAVLFKLSRLLPFIVLPLRTKDQDSECYINRNHGREMLLQGWLFMFEMVLLITAPIAILVLPGALLFAAAALAALIIYVSTIPMQGSRIVHSMMEEATTLAAKEHSNERWLFINGCITSHGGLQENVDRLAKTFGRAVTGIHNQTYGLPGDLIECLIQRCLSYSTMDARVAYEYLKACLTDPTVTKTVVIVHSQGGIIISLAMDHLFADLPAETFSKLEIYTFGSAASHFNNPSLFLPSPSITTTNDPRAHSQTNYIPHIEHYVNELDIVPRWGVLHNTARLPANRYAGSVFIRLGVTGHLFNQHYLSSMFPYSPEGRATVEAAERFLEQVVLVDKGTAEKREWEAGVRRDGLRRESRLGRVAEMGLVRNGEAPGKEGMGVEQNGGGEAGVVEAGAEVQQAKGKTVKELSRLWMYLGGAVPEN